MQIELKAVVFGGSGFLGSHVADALSDAGYSVKIFDIKRSQYLRPDQEMFIGDIMDSNQVKEAIKGVDYVFNFAGFADLDDARTKPMDTLLLNVAGNINMLEAAMQAGVKRYIYASTIYVYSQKGGFYRCSKQSAELYIEEFNRKYGIDYTVLRFGTLYGLRADKRNSIYRYLKEALKTGCITCKGTGEAMREYINVKDAARLTVEAVKEEYKNRHIIISGHHPMKYKEMLFMIKEMLGKDIKIEFVDEVSKDHYEYTPYSYAPKIGYKMVNNCYLDMGQGLLECLNEISQEEE